MVIKEYKYKDSKAVLTAYISDSIEGIELTYKRPSILIFPGGGYYNCSDREAEAISLKFMAKGYNAFILRYTVPSVYPTPLNEAKWAIDLIRKNSKEFMIDKNKIAVCGFSAGAHLAGMLSVMYGNDDYKPNACVLSYPVIDGTDYAHKGSFDNLLGFDADEELRKEFSLQYKVTSDTPPTFLWHTADDDTVPVQNSLLYAKALADNNVPFELRIFDKGIHGLSTCEPYTAHYEGHINPHCSVWFDDAIKFLERHL